MKVNITVFPRLHVDLINMNRNAYRINGGFGFTICDPRMNLVCEENDEFVFNDEFGHIKMEHVDKLEATISKCIADKHLKKNIKIKITSPVYPQMGFGTTTSIRLGCLEALMIINNYNYSEDELINISRRGGTSGIGIRTYFKGGYVFDIGHKNSEIHSSDVNEAIAEQSLLVGNKNMPDWQLGICIPVGIKTLTVAEEEDFFEANSNIDLAEIKETLYLVVNGLYAGSMENDVKIFGEAVNQLQMLGWKNAERNLYGPDLLDIEKSLYSCGATAVGMSSLGPSLYYFADNVSEVAISFSRIFKGEVMFYTTKTCNTGRIIDIC